MILDFHAHTYPPALAGRVISNMTAMQVPCYCDATMPGFRRSMKRAGITHAVICNIATKVGQSGSILAYAREISASNTPQEKRVLIPFASVHPYDPDWKQWLHAAKDAGYRGVKLHPDYQRFYIDDPRLEPFYREIAALGLVAVFHAGFDASMPENTHAPTERILNILPLLEEGVTVLAHMGGYAMERKTFRSLCGRNVYFDTSYNLEEIDLDLARDMFRKHGPERFVFGTDSPWKDQKQSLDYFRNVFAEGFLSQSDTHDVLWGTGARLLGLEEA